MIVLLFVCFIDVVLEGADWWCSVVDGEFFMAELHKPSQMEMWLNAALFVLLCGRRQWDTKRWNQFLKSYAALSCHCFPMETKDKDGNKQLLSYLAMADFNTIIMVYRVCWLLELRVCGDVAILTGCSSSQTFLLVRVTSIFFLPRNFFES